MVQHSQNTHDLIARYFCSLYSRTPPIEKNEQTRQARNYSSAAIIQRDQAGRLSKQIQTILAMDKKKYMYAVILPDGIKKK